MKPEPIPVETDIVAKQIVDASFKVHSALGPGLLESVYEACLVHELQNCQIKVERQVLLPIIYDGTKLDVGLRLDLIVEKQVIVEIKAAEKMLPVFEAQLLTYLKLANKRLGLLINFNVPLIKHGIRRLAL